MTWLNVEDSTPTLIISAGNGFLWESRYVLVYSEKYGVQKCCYYANEGKIKRWWWTTRHGQEITEVTHWMELPKPPSKDDNHVLKS